MRSGDEAPCDGQESKLTQLRNGKHRTTGRDMEIEPTTERIPYEREEPET